MVICSVCQLLTAAKVLWLALSFMGQSQQGRVISQPRALRWTRWPDIAHKRICRMSPGTVWRLPYHPLSPQWHRQEVTNVQAGLWVVKMPRAQRGKKRSHNEKTMFGWHTANKRSQGHYAAFNKQCLCSDECSPVPEHAHTAETMQWSTIFFPQRKKKNLDFGHHFQAVMLFWWLNLHNTTTLVKIKTAGEVLLSEEIIFLCKSHDFK